MTEIDAIRTALRQAHAHTAKTDEQAIHSQFIQICRTMAQAAVTVSAATAEFQQAATRLVETLDAKKRPKPGFSIRMNK